MLVFGTGVQVGVLHQKMYDALLAAALVSLYCGFDVYVTSWADKQHNPGSLHPFSLAIDLGVAGNDRAKVQTLYGWLTRMLSNDFDVVYEENHVHVEYDMHRATKDAAPPA